VWRSISSIPAISSANSVWLSLFSRDRPEADSSSRSRRTMTAAFCLWFNPVCIVMAPPDRPFHAVNLAELP
jgi:hypothetical protein